MKGWALLASTTTVIGVVALGSCGTAPVVSSSSSGAPSTDASHPPREAGASSGAPRDAEPDAPILGGDCGAPGWLRWDAFDSTCQVCVREADAEPLPPVEWSPCVWPDKPAELGCEQMTINWGSTGYVGPYFVSGTSEENGILLFERVMPEGNAWIAADATGRVRHGLLARRNSSCTIAIGGVSQGGVLHIVSPRRKDSSWYVYSELDRPVPVTRGGGNLRTGQDGVPLARGFARNESGVFVHLPPSYASEQIHTSSPGLLDTYLVSSSDALFWNEGGLRGNHIWTWTPGGTATKLLDGGNDYTSGMADFSTDGTDMVWVYAHGRSGTDLYERFPIIDLMTAPYTTDPASLRPRRLRSQPNRSFANQTTATGHGHAARVAAVDDETFRLDIVRLADGWTWSFTRARLDPVFRWLSVITMSQTHVYVRAQVDVGGRFISHIVRIPLAQLGPGAAAD